MGKDCCASKNVPAGPRYRRVLWVALVINAVMFAVELGTGVQAGSVSLQADALDFLGDAGNYALSLLVLGFSLRARSGAALFKAASMGFFGLWVMVEVGLNTIRGTVPAAEVMGVVGVAALLANVAVAAMLYRYREGDSNMRSVWLCTRNDVLGNLAVLVAASFVFLADSLWPDVAVAVIMASLALSGAVQVSRQALAERRSCT